MNTTITAAYAAVLATTFSFETLVSAMKFANMIVATLTTINLAVLLVANAMMSIGTSMLKPPANPTSNRSTVRERFPKRSLRDLGRSYWQNLSIGVSSAPDVFAMEAERTKKFDQPVKFQTLIDYVQVLRSLHLALNPMEVDSFGIGILCLKDWLPVLARLERFDHVC